MCLAGRGLGQGGFRFVRSQGSGSGVQETQAVALLDRMKKKKKNILSCINIIAQLIHLSITIYIIVYIKYYYI